MINEILPNWKLLNWDFFKKYYLNKNYFPDSELTSFKFIVDASIKSDKFWRLFFINGIGGFAACTWGGSFISILLCWKIHGRFMKEFVYVPYKFMWVKWAFFYINLIFFNQIKMLKHFDNFFKFAVESKYNYRVHCWNWFHFYNGRIVFYFKWFNFTTFHFNVFSTSFILWKIQSYNTWINIWKNSIQWGKP